MGYEGILPSDIAHANWLEVRSLAAEGRLHPDPEIRTSALDWARDEVARPLWRRAGVGAGALVAAAMGDQLAAGDAVEARARRRLAKRLLRLERAAT